MRLENVTNQGPDSLANTNARIVGMAVKSHAHHLAQRLMQGRLLHSRTMGAAKRFTRRRHLFLAHGLRIEQIERKPYEMKDNYDDEVLLCMSLLRALANANYGYCEALVKHADCSPERKADALQYIIGARAGYG